jgi:nucleoside 2-deoxyribosyltransferase
MNIYLASSWRNKRHAEVLASLRAEGYEVFDFKNPAPGNRGFHWSEIDPDWRGWSPNAFVSALGHPLARAGFAADLKSLKGADAVVLLMPCGRSAHLEAGWAAGAGKPVVLLLPIGESFEPELMYRLAAAIVTTIGECLAALRGIECELKRKKAQA